MTSLRILAVTCWLLVLCSSTFPANAAPTVPLYRNPNAPLAARVNDLYSRLTEKEKLTLLTGTEYTSQPLPGHNLPGIIMADAGQGVRGGDSTTQGPATAFPCGLIMASSWDQSLLWQVGHAIGEEARNKGTGIQMELAPGVNIQRSPLNGRTSEYLGEDPYVSAHLAVPFIEGIQSTGVAACVKHYACNNEEQDRQTVNVTVSERALREIYLPAFEAAVTKAHVDAIMAAYNKVNGPFAAANWYLLHVVLRQDWGFEGLALSDWGAVHETARTISSGLDLEMPGPGFLTEQNINQALQNGSVNQGEIDLAVKHILKAVIQCGLADPARQAPDHKTVGSPAHEALAYKAAIEGAVLLKNDNNQLPLDPDSIGSIALIGLRAKQWQMNTGGSPFVDAIASTSAFHGIALRLSQRKDFHLYYAAAFDNTSKPIPDNLLTPLSGHGTGLSGSYYSNMTFSGRPHAKRIDKYIQFFWNSSNSPQGIGPFNFSVRWKGTLKAPRTGDFKFTCSADDGCRLWIDNKEIINHWFDGGAVPIDGHINLVAGHSYPIRLDYYQHGGGSSVTLNWYPPSDAELLHSQAIDEAKNASVAIVFVGTNFEEESKDRSSMALPDNQDQLIKDVEAVNPHTIVVLNNGGPVLLSNWINNVPAVIEMGFPGELGGKALASLLFGDADPSGKLTETIAVRRQDYPDYPNFPGNKQGQVKYAEGIYVGYRAFDKRNITPQFPFGYGLSYTTFSYSNISVSNSQWNADGTVDVTADVSNTGSRAGAEIAELYVEPKSPQIDRPIRELKGFSRVDLAPGETKTAQFVLYPRDFAYCDVPGKQWRADAGDYSIEVGASSRNILLSAPITLTNTWTQPIAGIGSTDPHAPLPSLADGKPAYTSSTMHNNLASFAVDGDPSTMWESHWCSPQWLKVDLGIPTSFSHVELSWNTANAQAYAIQVSDDNRKWKTVYGTTNPEGGVEEIHFAPVTARWVRLYTTRRNTAYGYALYNLAVYAQ
jgi:beta-glucosidase